MSKRSSRRSRERHRAPETARAPHRGLAAPHDRFGLWLLAVSIVALALRLVVLRQLLDLPLFRTPQLDSLEYLLRAERFLRGDYGTPSVPLHGPAYPLFLAAVFRVFGESVAAAGVVQCVLGAAVCALTGWLGRRWFGGAAGLLGAGFVAVEGPLVLIGTSIFAESLLLFLVVLAVVLFESRPTTLLRAAGSGACLGLAAAVRPTAIVLVPLLALLAWRRRSDSPRPWLTATVLAAAGFAMLAPVLIGTFRATGSLLLVQGNSGLNFYLGNSPSGRGVASGRVGGSWDAIAGEALRRGNVRAADQDRYYVRKALDEIRARPGAYIALLGRKLLLSLQAEEVRDSHSAAFFADRIPLLRWLPGFGFLFAFAACGVREAHRLGRVPPAGAAAILGFLLTCVLLVVGTRYRLPLVPLLAPFAGLGAWRLFESVRARRRREALALAAILLGAGVLAHLLHDPPSHRFAEEWSLTGNSLAKEGDPAGAAAAYRRALDESPSFGPAWTGVGILAAKRGDWPEARRDFERAAAVDPDGSRAHHWLGLALENGRDLAGASRELKRAVDIRPDDPDALRALARVSAAAGAWSDAERASRDLLRQSPDDAAARLDLARSLAALGRLPEAHSEASRATVLDPKNADGWLFRAVVAIDLHRPDDARLSLDRAEALAGGSPPPIAFARALLDRREGRPDAAVARLMELLGRHPDFQPAVDLLLETARQAGRSDEANAFLRSLRRGAAR